MSDRAEVLARWAAIADRLCWARRPDQVYAPAAGGHGHWFPGGELDLVTNAVDRHAAAHPDKPALHWEGEPGDRRTVTFGELRAEVDATAAAFAGLGIGRGDRVALHLGFLPEAVVAILACARLGALHAVLPAVLPAEAVALRLRDLRPRLLVTQDGAWRHGIVVPLKARADEALTAVAGVEHTVVVRRVGIDVSWYEGDCWWHELARPAGVRLSPRPVPADHPYLVCYVANRRGSPTGLVHGTAGLLAFCLEMHEHGFGARPGEAFWVPAELGWAASQSHGILGPLAAGGTVVGYEGMLDTPHHGRAWEIIERYGVSGLVMTPSVARALRRWADHPPAPAQVASLRVIITAGEPIDEGTAGWLASAVGGGRVRVGNAWGLTELGGAVVVDPPITSLGMPDLGLEVVDPAGRTLPAGEIGELVLTHPWPATALRVLDPPELDLSRLWTHPAPEQQPAPQPGVHTPPEQQPAPQPGMHALPEQQPGLDPSRPGMFVTGDRARRREDGGIEFLGRIDRVFSVSGQLVSATEIRSVLEEHPFVVRAEVVDRPDPRTGRAVVACVALAEGASATDALVHELCRHVHETLGGLAQPQVVAFVDRFPAGIAEDALHRALQALSLAAPRSLQLSEEQLAAAARSLTPR